MIPGPPPTIETARLVLRPFALSDAKDVQRLAGDYTVSNTTLNIPHPYEDGMAEEWIASLGPRFDSGTLCTLAIVRRDTRELIGAIGLSLSPRFARAEVGYWIGKAFWGNGYCTEAAQAILHYGFTVLGLNLLGDGLRDILDPQSTTRRA